MIEKQIRYSKQREMIYNYLCSRKDHPSAEKIYEELRKMKSNVHITALCPGPVSTNFQTVANVKFNAKPLDSEYVAIKAVDGTLKNKRHVVLGYNMRVFRFFSRFIPDKVMLKIAYKAQSKKK